MTDKIDELKNLPPLTQQVCGTCEFFVNRHSPMYSWCKATSKFAEISWSSCQGKYWAPKPPHVPVFIQLKRWLFG